MGSAAPTSGKYIQSQNFPRVFNMKTETACSPKYFSRFQTTRVTSLITVILLLTSASEIEVMSQNRNISNSATFISMQRDERRQEIQHHLCAFTSSCSFTIIAYVVCIKQLK